MPRTTLNIDRSVLDELRQEAEREERSLGELASELLAQALAQRERKRPEFVWFHRDLGPARINLDDWAAVREFLDNETLDLNP